MVFYDPKKEESKSQPFLFTLSTCVHCKRAKKLLHDLNMPYNFVDVDQLSDAEMNQALEEMSEYNPAQTFPTIIGAGKVIVGDREDDIRQMVEKLQAAK